MTSARPSSSNDASTSPSISDAATGARAQLRHHDAAALAERSLEAALAMLRLVVVHTPRRALDDDRAAPHAGARAVHTVAPRSIIASRRSRRPEAAAELADARFRFGVA